MNKKERTGYLLMVIAICISIVGILLDFDKPVLALFIVVPTVLVGIWYLYEVETACNEAYRKELIKEVIKEMKNDEILKER